MLKSCAKARGFEMTKIYLVTHRIAWKEQWTSDIADAVVHEFPDFA